MQLCYSATSPYVRKVLMTALETGTRALFDTIPTSPWEASTDLAETNPLCKVPALILDSGVALFDSPVICEYLDSLHSGHRIFPDTGIQRFMALRLQALGDGIMDAAILRRLESARPAAMRSQDWISRQRLAMQRGLDDLQNNLDSLGGEPHIGSVTAACALAYLDFRYADEPWRSDREALAEWHQEWLQRPSMVATQPPDGA